MSHFSVLLIHSGDESDVMAKYNYDAKEECGAKIEFQAYHTEAEAEELYQEHIKENPEDIEGYPDAKTFMEEYHCYSLEDGEWGCTSNEIGMYDWHEVGGRWNEILPNFGNVEELQALLDKETNIELKEVQEKYRDKADEYIKIKSMSLQDACTYLGLGGANSIRISEEIKPEHIIEYWRNIEKGWAGYEKNDAVKSMIHNMIIHEIGEEDMVYYSGDDNISEKVFIEKYNYFLELNKNEDADYYVTIIDCHT